MPTSGLKGFRRARRRIFHAGRKRVFQPCGSSTMRRLYLGRGIIVTLEGLVIPRTPATLLLIETTKFQPILYILDSTGRPHNPSARILLSILALSIEVKICSPHAEHTSAAKSPTRTPYFSTVTFFLDRTPFPQMGHFKQTTLSFVYAIAGYHESVTAGSSANHLQVPEAKFKLIF